MVCAFHVPEGNRMKERGGEWVVWSRDGCHPELSEVRLKKTETTHWTERNSDEPTDETITEA